MFDREAINKIFEGIVWFNNKLGIWAFIIPAIFALAVLYQLYRSYKQPSEKNRRSKKKIQTNHGKNSNSCLHLINERKII